MYSNFVQILLFLFNRFRQMISQKLPVEANWWWLQITSDTCRNKPGRWARYLL